MGPLTRAAALAILLLGLTAGPVSATTFTVNNKGDGTDQSTTDGLCNTSAVTANVCTLRAAIQQANSPTSPNADTIVLPAGTYSLTLSPPGEDAAAGGDLDVTQAVTIDGGGARATTVKQTIADRVFDVRPGAQSVTIEGVTITGGDPGAGNGAGVLNAAQTLIVDSAVRDNRPTSSTTSGAGIANISSLTVDRSLITGNQTPAAGGGGGIFNDTAGTVTVRNSTISNNTAIDGSAIRDNNGTILEYSTITGNTSTDGAAVSRTVVGRGMRSSGSIIAINGGTGANCAGPGFQTGGHNIESGTSCNFTDGANGDRQNADPVLGALAYSAPGDQTETHVPQPGSPAIDGGSAVGCPATDQRGQTRPLGATCDIGAVEVQAAQPPPPAPRPAALTLDPPSADRTPGDANTVTAKILNDDGSPAAGRSVRYAIAGPNEGAGAVTTGPDGTAQISWDGVHEGTDVLSAYVDTNLDLTPGADEPTGAASVKWALPAPVQGRTANIEPVSGTVRFTVKGSAKGRIGAAGATSLLSEARQVPLSTVVDTRRGRVRMTTVSNSAGDLQKGEFYGGVYTSRQSRTSGRPITELSLAESLICQPNQRSGKLVAARARSRHLWGNAKGRFRTRGRHSTATVRGTVWLQKDGCNSTTTVVRQGVVTVRDLAKRKDVRVKAGRRYVARRQSRRRR